MLRQPLSLLGQAFSHLLFPHICQACGSDVLQPHQQLCLHCVSSLPATRFEMHAANPVEKLFWGRLPLAAASARYYFTKESTMQHLMHQVKYRGNRHLSIFLGRLMGEALMASHRFGEVDVLVPLPLHPHKEKLRGYNQAALLCKGVGEVMMLPVLDRVVRRTEATSSQTRKTRMERWMNVEGKFQLGQDHGLQQAHILLVDDVVTTGATLEACGRALLQAEGARLSVATLCFSSH